MSTLKSNLDFCRVTVFLFGVLTTRLCAESDPRREVALGINSARATASTAEPTRALLDTGTGVSIAPQMKGDDEFGEQLILARRAHVEPWSLAVDAQYFYTDNVALVSEGKQDDFYLRSGVTVQYANRIVGDWFADASLSSCFYFYDEHDFFDFQLVRGEAGVTKRLTWLADAFLSAHYCWYSIAEPVFGETDFQDQIASLNLQKIWKISRGQQITAGLGADFSMMPVPEEPGRHEYSAYACYKLRLTEEFSMQVGYRGAYYDYAEAGRQDWNHSVTLICAYEITDWARIMLSASGSINRSSMPFFDYDNIVSGVGLSFHIEF